MPLQKSEYACPRCKRETGKSSQIVANMGELLCSENGTHRWPDVVSFLEEKPTMEFKVDLPKVLPQQNYTPYTVSIPIGLKDALEKTYGEKAGPTVASILMQMIEGRVMIVGQTDLDRLGSAQGLGKVPENSGEMFGMIFALREEVAEAKMIADAAQRDVKAYEGISIGRTVVDLGDQYQAATVKAQDASLPLGAWASKALRDGLENGWF